MEGQRGREEIQPQVWIWATGRESNGGESAEMEKRRQAENMSGRDT